MAPASQFEAAPPPVDLIGAIKFAPDSPTRLLAASWDRNLYRYEIRAEGVAEPEAVLAQQYEHPSPVMDVCFGATDDEAFTASIDGQVRRIDLTTGELTTITKYSKPARCVAYSRVHSILISTSWDCALRFHNMADPSHPSLEVVLPGKPHAMAASPSKVVVAMVARLVHIYDLPTVAAAFSSANGDSTAAAEAALKPWQQRESSLKFLTRAVACMPNDAGYATSSIEGRVAVEWFEDSAESQARKYAFKCHRQAASEEEGGGDIVYPVNGLAFHPLFGTFVSGGGDGTVALWDAAAKRRMKQYQKFPNSVMALAFSRDGKYLAIGTAPGFTTDMDDYNGEGQAQLFIRELGESEAKGKGAK